MKKKWLKKSKEADNFFETNNIALGTLLRTGGFCLYPDVYEFSQELSGMISGTASGVSSVTGKGSNFKRLNK